MDIFSFDVMSIKTEGLMYLLGLLSIPFKNMAQGAWNRMFHDLPFVSGTYKSCYKFRRKGGEEVDAEETIRVRKLGRWVWATAEMTKPMSRKWKIHGEIRGRYLFATVEAATRKTLSGKGYVLLKSLANGNELSGQMIWVDSKLESIWATPYEWHRADKEEQD